MIGGVPSAGFGSPMNCPQSFAAKNHSRTQNSDQTAADVKNTFGLGKNDLNISFAFWRDRRKELGEP